MTTNSKRALLALSLGLGVLWGGAPTRAQANGPYTNDEARSKYEEAVAAFKAGEYERAIAAFEQSYELSKEPILLFNIGQAHRLSGNCAKALDYYKRYRESLGADQPLAGYRDAIARCEQVLKKTQEVERKAVNGGSAEPAQPVEPNQPPEPAAATTGSHAAVAEVREPAAPRPSFWRRHVVSLAAGGTAVALAGTGLAFGLAARSQYNDLADQCAFMPARCPPGQLDSIERKALVTNILLPTAAAVGIGAAVYFFLVEERGTEERRLAIVPGTGGASLVVRY